MRESNRVHSIYNHNNKYNKGIIITLCIIIFSITIIFNSGNHKAYADTINEKCYRYIEVETGDSLWSIAEEYMSEEYDSIDDYIDEVKQINNIKSDKIYRGATLVIPYYIATR